MSDKDELLDAIHLGMCRVILDKIKSGKATAADLSVARQFLKDNNIDATTKSRPELGKIAKGILDSVPVFPEQPKDYQ